jgi:tyrosyl-tRNA synthetase
MTEGAEDHLAEAPRTVYIGFDPTGPSLHLGSLLPVMGLMHAQRAGHTPIALVGGGTGLIGDPSGKTAERQLLTKEDVARNAEGIRKQLEHFLDFGAVSNAARMRNNLDWLGGLPLVDFMRDIGKHFSVNQMLAKEAVKRRVEGSEAGISFTEFSYSLLQSYDFLQLARTEGCTVQMGGSDQWGNITAGIDLGRSDCCWRATVKYRCRRPPSTACWAGASASAPSRSIPTRLSSITRPRTGPFMNGR